MSVRVVDTKHGKVVARDNELYVGRSLCMYGEYSHGEIKMLEQFLRPGDVAVDVGAQMGALTIPMASIVGPRGLVYAFEPQRVVFQQMCAGLALNDYRNVMAVNAPVGSQQGLRVLVPDLPMDGTINLGGLSLVEPHREGVAYDMVTVDQYNLPACRLIKADVEGMEVAVLTGARRTIERHKPIIIAEANDEGYARALMGFLLPLGYRCSMHFSPLYRWPNPRNNRKNVFGNAMSFDMVALPEWWTEPEPKGLRPIKLDDVGAVFYERKEA
jgi:FkbM family methyltransferase